MTTRFEQVGGFLCSVAAMCALAGEAGATLPTRAWSTYLGGSGGDEARSVAVDAAGNIYVFGLSSSPDGIATPGADRPAPVGPDCFLVKFDPGGARLWGTYVGGDSQENCFAVAAGPDGVVVVGSTNSSDLATAGAFQTVKQAGADGYVARYTPDGARQWATYVGGAGTTDQVNAAAFAAGGELYVGGLLAGPVAGVTTPGTHQPDYGGGSTDGFVLRLDAAGLPVWGTYYGGAVDDHVFGLALGASGEVYAVGATSSTQAIATAGAHQDAFAGFFDGFLVRLDAQGARVWGTYLGSDNSDQPFAVATLPGGGVALAMVTRSSSGLATPGSHQELFGGGQTDLVLARFDPAGVRLWSTYVGGSSEEFNGSLAVDPSGGIYLTGGTRSPDGIASPDAYDTTLGGIADGFVARFAPTGARVWGTYFGGEVNDQGQGVGVLDSDRLVLAGFTSSSTGITTPGAHDETYNGGQDTFLALFVQDQGLSCAADAECGSGACVDGVCCDSPCGGGATGDCQACSVAAGASIDGVCAPASAAVTCRPAAGECDAAEQCDGDDLECPPEQSTDDQPCADGVCMAGVCTPDAVTSTDATTTDTTTGEPMTTDTTTGEPITTTDTTTGTDLPTSTSGTTTGDAPTSDTGDGTTGGGATSGGDAPTTGDTPTSAGPPDPGGGSSESSESTGDAPSDGEAGCGCATSGPDATGLLLLALPALARRRRRA